MEKEEVSPLQIRCTGRKLVSVALRASDLEGEGEENSVTQGKLPCLAAWLLPWAIYRRPFGAFYLRAVVATWRCRC